MHNPITSKNSSKPLQSVADTSHSTMEDTTSELSSKAKTMANEASETMSEYYHQASTFFQGETGRVVGWVSLAAVIGLAGFFIGRSMSHSHESFADMKKAS